VNRATRRAAAKRAAALLRYSPRPGASVECELRGHVWGDTWTLRPPLVGAGIVIPKVHFDRVCRRCGSTDRVWVDIVGECRPMPASLPLVTWLEQNHATVQPPAGRIVAPNVGAVVDAVLSNAP